MNIRKWYFAVNEKGLASRGTFELIIASVRSAQRFTSLQPHLLYYGEENKRLKQIASLGVKIIPRKPSLEADLRYAYGEKFAKFVGHWLRVDLPFVETEDDYVLYTDIDVLFHSFPLSLPPPKFISAGPEFERGRFNTFNSGVMIMNLRRLRPLWAEFTGAIRVRLRGDFTYPSHDQHSFNEFFGDIITRLPDEMNWRPYWGFNEDAHLIHFHGPKPNIVVQLLAGARDEGWAHLMPLFDREPEAYKKFMAFYGEQGIWPPEIPEVPQAARRA